MNVFKTLLIALLTLSAAPWLSAGSLTREADVVRRLEIDVDHEPLTSLWVEIYDDQDTLIAAWYAPWDDEAECISGLDPLWVEMGVIDGWSSFAVLLPEPGHYRVVVVSLNEVWELRLFSIAQD